MNKKINSLPVPFGICSLGVIFCTLCLVILCLLSLSSARAGLRLSEMSAKKVSELQTARYEADMIISVLRHGDIPEGVKAEGDGVYSFCVPVNDSESLFVKVEIYNAAGPQFDILEEYTQRTGEWKADDGIDLYEPDFAN